MLILLVVKARRVQEPLETGALLPEKELSEPAPEATVSEPGKDNRATAEKRLPRLVDLGAGQCVPCKMMAPILEELKREFRGKMEVEIIDVWEDRQAGERYGIRVIPTQIFFDRDGKEVFRHEGFMSREDILETWKRLGVDLGG
ncbi:MAG TPA: thioredoxin family protein [bacterium]|nr:thioredoxin family protein [bacterium]